MYFQWYFREIVNNRPVSRKSIKLKLRKKSFSNLQISLNVKESLVSLHFLYSARYQKWWGFQKKGLCYSWHLHQVYFEKISLSKVFLWGNIRAQSSTCRLYGLPMSNCWKQNLTMKMKNNSWISRLGWLDNLILKKTLSPTWTWTNGLSKLKITGKYLPILKVNFGNPFSRKFGLLRAEKT